MRIFLDIETIANERAAEYCKTDLVKVDSRLKDEEKIAKAREDAISKAGLTWWTGQVCSICAIAEDDREFRMTSGDETALLVRFCAWVMDLETQMGIIQVVGKNLDEFDQPFLIGRCMARGVVMPHSISGKPYKHGMRDIDDIWAKYRCGQHGKLDDYAWGFAIPLKPSHGSKVQGMFNDGRLPEIEDYCMHDAKTVKLIFDLWERCTC